MKRLFIHGPGAGGTAKTTAVEMGHATYASRGERILLVDADVANHSLTDRLGAQAVGMQLRDFENLVGVAERILLRAQETDAAAVAIDLGASALALCGVDTMLAELMERTTAEGVDVWFVLSVVPQKPGAPRELARMLQGMSAASSVRTALFFSDTNGSGAYGEVANLKADARVNLGHIMPGLMELRRQHVGSVIDAVVAHGPDHGRAAGMLARVLRQCFRQEDWQRVYGPLGCEADAALRQAVARAPSWHYAGRCTLADVSDAALEADEGLILAQHRLQQLQPSAAASELLAAARGFVAANARRREVRGRQGSSAKDRAA